LAVRKNILLYPLSVAYGFITGLRNFLYNSDILKAKEFNIPVICVGNITVGGTGKTPHCEFLINLLKNKFRVAFLSRGYKRKTRGFIIATPSSTTKEIGDEPMQIFMKNPDILVAVDGNRIRGIKNILNQKPDTEVIILDDGFQHRKLKPGLSILLTDYNRPMNHDHLLPFGELRESIKNIYRADIIIVSKCPDDITPIQRRIVQREIKKAPYQNLFFTSISYDNPLPVFNSDSDSSLLFSPDKSKKYLNVLLVTGIADPEPLAKYLNNKSREVKHLCFPDHHTYSKKDISRIEEAFRNLPPGEKIILTTEKDAVRLKEMFNIVPDELRAFFYYIPVRINFLNNNEKDFNNLIINYVGKNKRNNRFS